jgi:pyrroline-5-carboxylate reductase
MSRVSVLGGGHMARALIGGWLKEGTPAQDIAVSDPDPRQRTTMLGAFSDITVAAQNDEVARLADTWVVAVKPADVAAVARPLAARVEAQAPLVVSVAAGVRLDALSAWFGPKAVIVRAMPNRPA